MLSWETNVEVHALRKQGWSISAIARHVGVTRLTVRRYLRGERVPGQRAKSTVDPFEEYGEYCRLRLAGDPHLWATTLFEEVVGLGYAGSYPSFTRGLRARSLRPYCAACAGARRRDRGLIEHPSGEETQWDWVELPDPPTSWGWGQTAYVLVGVLAHSSRCRAWLAERTDTGHLVEGLDQVVRRLGGVSRRWRFDRMSTVCHPGSGRLRASFAPVAVHYGVGVDLCPAGHSWRKGAVEKAIHVITQRWWRTVPDGASLAVAQASLDAICAGLDRRRRMRDGAPTTVRELAEAEPLRPAPAPFAATVEVIRRVRAPRRWSRSAATATRCRLATPASRSRCATSSVDPLWTLSAPEVWCWHGTCGLRTAPGCWSGPTSTSPALHQAVMAEAPDRGACRRKDRRPPSAAALAEADRIGAARAGHDVGAVVVDFAAYAAATRPLGRDTTGGAR